MAKKEAKASNLQEAKILVREAVGKVAKDAVQSYRDYKYVSHEAVTAAVVPAMHKVGMTHTPSCESIEVHDGIAFVRVKVLFQMAKEWCDTEDLNAESTYAYTADKIKDGTSMGAIISYGIKTALLKYFGLESGDPDLESFQKPDKAKEKVSKNPPKVSPAAQVEETVDIFNGTVLADLETIKKFVDLCTEAGVDSDQLDLRIKEEGFDNMDEVPKEVMEDWCVKMEDANA